MLSITASSNEQRADRGHSANVAIAVAAMKLFGGAHFRSSLRHFLIGRAMQGVVALVLTLVTIRVMAPADYGVFLVVFGLVDLMRPLSSLGVLPTIQQFLPEMALHATPAQLRRFVSAARWLRWGLLAGLALALYASWRWVAAFAGIPTAAGPEPVLVCLVICAVLGLEYAEATLEALLEQQRVQAIRLTHTALRLAGVLALALAGRAQVNALLWMELLAAFTMLVWTEQSLRLRIGRLQPDGSRLFSTTEILRFGAHLSFSQLLSALATPGAIRILVSRALGVEVAGQFGFMQTLLSQVNRLLPSLLLMNLVRPMLIAARVRGQLSVVAEACGLLFKSNVLLVWPLVPAMLLVGDELMARLSGGRLQGMGLAMTGLMLALIAMTQMQVASIVLQVHRMSGRLAWAGLLSLLAPLLVWLAAPWSLVVACFALFLATGARNAVTMLMIQRSQARVQLDAVGVLRFALAIAAALAVAWWVRAFSVWLALVVFFALVVVFGMLAKPLAGFEARVLQEALRRQLPLIRWFVSSR